MKKKNGFTLIELLAVIIILGILMIIAIPSVTRYISDSRKAAYVDTAKEITAGARNLVNEGKLEMYDTNTTYYIPTSCIKTENASKSPYGDFIKDKTYVVVTYDGKGYSYYWVSLDDAGQGVSELKSIDELDTDDIKSDLTRDDIIDNIGVGNRKKVKIFSSDCTTADLYDALEQYKITLDANGGKFSNGKNTHVLKYTKGNGIAIKYSHTSNINDRGQKLTDYGNNWTNANIVGTDRGDITKAHVVTIPGATNLNITVTFGSQNAYSDLACMFKGNHLEYTTSNCSSSYSGRLGGGSHTDSSNTKVYNISGDTVTFVFSSNNYGVGDGYGYYAKIEGQGETFNVNNDYEEPVKSGSSLWWWKSSVDGKIYTSYEVSKMIPNKNDVLVAQWNTEKLPLCIRATNLHQEICRNTSGYCSSVVGNNNLITYGNTTTTDGVLTTGDAFDCDVNGDGEYDSMRERFYYVSDYYDTNTDSFNTDYATLVYYTNYRSGVLFNTQKNNYDGPNVVGQELPSKSEWTNTSLLNETRKIINENQESTSNNNEHNLSNYTYENRAARLLTYQEINAGCYKSKKITQTYGLLSCIFLFENTSFSYMNRTDSYWLETPSSSSSTFVWFPTASGIQLGGLNANTIESSGGARPAIDVKKTDIDY